MERRTNTWIKIFNALKVSFKIQDHLIKCLSLYFHFHYFIARNFNFLWEKRIQSDFGPNLLLFLFLYFNCSTTFYLTSRKYDNLSPTKVFSTYCLNFKLWSTFSPNDPFLKQWLTAWCRHAPMPPAGEYRRQREPIRHWVSAYSGVLPVSFLLQPFSWIKQWNFLPPPLHLSQKRQLHNSNRADCYDRVRCDVVRLKCTTL